MNTTQQPTQTTAPSAALAAAQKAASTYEADLAKLTGPDGQPVYAPAKEEALRAGLHEMFTDALDSVVDGLRQQREAAEAKMSIAYADPAAGLDNAELQRAALLAPFVREELANLEPETLEKRLQWVATQADTPTVWAYHRYASRLVEDIAEKGRGGVNTITIDGPAPRGVNGITSDGQARLTVLRAALPMLEQKATPEPVRKQISDAGAKIEQIAGDLREISKLRQMAGAQQPTVAF